MTSVVKYTDVSHLLTNALDMIDGLMLGLKDIIDNVPMHHSESTYVELLLADSAYDLTELETQISSMKKYEVRSNA